MIMFMLTAVVHLPRSIRLGYYESAHCLILSLIYFLLHFAVSHFVQIGDVMQRNPPVTFTCLFDT